MTCRGFALKQPCSNKRVGVCTGTYVCVGTGPVFWFCRILFLILLLMTSLKECSVPISLPGHGLPPARSLFPTVFLHVGYLSITCFCLHFAHRAGPTSNALPSPKPFLTASILPPLHAVPVTTPYFYQSLPCILCILFYYPLNSLGTWTISYEFPSPSSYIRVYIQYYLLNVIGAHKCACIERIKE